VGFRANSRFDFNLKTHVTVGFIEHELIFTAYCRDNFFVKGIRAVRLLPRINWMLGKFGKLRGIILVHDSE